MSKVSAINIKKLYYTNAVADNAADITASALKTAITNATEIDNVHQDTWSIEESEPSQDFYKNQLTGFNYREGKKTMGDVTFNFTIGQYDYTTKAALMGGTATASSWKRARGVVNIKKMLIALTEDDVYVVLPYANVTTRESNADGAIGLAVVGTALEPKSTNVAPEYWYDKSAVDAA